MSPSNTLSWRVAASLSGYGIAFMLELIGQAIAVLSTASKMHPSEPLKWSVPVFIAAILSNTFFEPTPKRWIGAGLGIWAINLAAYHIAVRTSGPNAYQDFSNVQGALRWVVAPTSLSLVAAGFAALLLNRTNSKEITDEKPTRAELARSRNHAS